MRALARLLSRLRRWPAPTDIPAVRRMTVAQWATISQRTPTYLDAYRDRPGSDDRAQRRAEWIAARPEFQGVGGVVELGCGAGRNLAALRRLYPDLVLAGVDINQEAIAEARRAVPDGGFLTADLYTWAAQHISVTNIVLTCGVLVHLEPSSLDALLPVMLADATSALLLVEETSPDDQVAKGPRSWRPDKVTDDYCLWRPNLVRRLLAAGASAVVVTPLPEDLRAPGATELVVVRR